MPDDAVDVDREDREDREDRVDRVDREDRVDRVDRVDAGATAPLTDLAFGILLALSGRELHGYALIQELRGRTGRDGLRTGTVYAALARLQDEGWVEEVVDRRDEDDDPRRKYYAVTRSGRATARAEARRLAELLALASAKRLLAETP